MRTFSCVFGGVQPVQPAHRFWGQTSSKSERCVCSYQVVYIRSGREDRDRLVSLLMSKRSSYFGRESYSKEVHIVRVGVHAGVALASIGVNVKADVDTYVCARDTRILSSGPRVGGGLYPPRMIS